MDALPPSLPNAGLPQPALAGTAGLAILLAELTQALAKLPAGTQIPALVTQILPQPQTQAQSPPSPQPQPQLQPQPSQPSPPPSPNSGPVLLLSTPGGPAQVRVPATAQIPVGAKLDIAIATAGPQPQWRLIAIDGKPVSPALAPPTPVAEPVTAPSATAVATVATAPRPTPAPGIPATLVKSTDPALPSGTTLLVRITNLVPPPTPQIQAQAPEPEPEPKSQQQPESAPEEPEATPSSPSSPAPAAAPMTTAPAAPMPAPVTVAAAQIPTPTTAPVPTQAPATPAVTVTTAPVLAPAPAPVSGPLTPPSPIPAPTTAPAPAPPPTEIGGEVLPNSDAGRPLVKTPVGLLALSVEPQSAPPTGAHVTLAVIGKPVPPAAPLLAPSPDEPRDSALPRRLADLVEEVQNSGNEKLAEAVRQALPSPGPKLAAQLLSVIASADPSQGLPRLLGDGLMTALSHGAPEAMAGLGRQWEAISQPVQGPDNGDWRSLLMPLMMGGQMNSIRLTTRNPRRGASPADREKGTRFLLDLDLSRLGPMQFDGLVKRQHKRFDLIIRTKEPLPGEMRRDIDGLFLAGLVNFGLQGSVAFQPDGRFVATPPLTGDANGIIFA